jgi:hypothetical protein
VVDEEEEVCCKELAGRCRVGLRSEREQKSWLVHDRILDAETYADDCTALLV